MSLSINSIDSFNTQMMMNTLTENINAHQYDMIRIYT